MVRAIRERVAANYPTEGAGGLRLPDLMPAVHARDAAEGKVAAIGTVNPRPPGFVNDLAQSAKRLIARALDWHVREQVEFNRGVLAAIDALIETHNETNRALAALSSRLAPLEEAARAAGDGTDGVRQLASQWNDWRNEWQTKLNVTEIKFLRSVAEMQNAFQFRTTQLEAGFQQRSASAEQVLERRLAELEARVAERLTDAKKAIEEVTAAYRAALEEAREFTREGDRALAAAHQASLIRASDEIQKRLWADLETVRRELQSTIHRELRILRQRPASATTPATEPRHAWPAIDWTLFAEKFRGPEDAIRKRFERYLPFFAGASEVVDLGCGRGEFLELLRREGVPAKGVDLGAANIATCREKGLDVVESDFFAWLEDQPDASLGGIFCAQVIEHLEAPDVPRLIALCARKLRRGAPIVFETPNPECLAIFATHFYIDPTHVRPLPPVLMHFYLEEAGFVDVVIERFAAAADSWPELAQLPEAVRERFFGFLDYAISARNAS